MGKYERRRRGEQNFFQSLFQEEREREGTVPTGYGIEFGAGRELQRDEGGVRGNRGAVKPDHAVARRFNHGDALSYKTRNSGPPDSYTGARHLNSGITRPAYSPQQAWVRPCDGAGLSFGPAWAPTQRVRANSGIEYDPNEGAIYGGRNSRGPF
jgi:hypothetical protein